ncbi:MAG: hypothetical protein MESAZ_02353 [Saezia sanguinis]
MFIATGYTDGGGAVAVEVAADEEATAVVAQAFCIAISFKVAFMAPHADPQVFVGVLFFGVQAPQVLVDCCACVPAVGEQGTLGTRVDFSTEVVIGRTGLLCAHADDAVVDRVPGIQALYAPAGVDFVVGTADVTKPSFVTGEVQVRMGRVVLKPGREERQVGGDAVKVPSNACVGCQEVVFGAFLPAVGGGYNVHGSAVKGDGTAAAVGGAGVYHVRGAVRVALGPVQGTGVEGDAVYGQGVQRRAL